VLSVTQVNVDRNWIVLVIFWIRYGGIAVWHMPALKVSRTGIILLGVIALMIFAGVTTSDAVAFINWQTI
jgi:hypothetical protein